MLKKRILAIFTSAALIAGAMPAAFASADAASSSREFTQDFESEDYKVSPVWGKYKNTAGKEFEYINNGATASKALAADTVYVVEGDLYNNQYAEDGTLQAPTADMPVGDWKTAYNFKNSGYLTDNLRAGGFDGYTGMTSTIHIMPQIWGSVSWFHPRGDENMMLKTADGSRVLSCLLSSDSGFNTNTATSYSAVGFDWFGKEGMELYGYKSKISFDIRNHKTAWQEKDDSSNGFVTLSITKNVGNMKDKLYNKTHTPVAQAKAVRYSINSAEIFKTDKDNDVGAVTDAVTIYKGAAYLGNTVSAENKICDMMTYNDAGRDTSWYTVEVYIDYETNPTSPDLAVIIKNRADGSVVGAKSGKLPVSDGATATSAYGQEKGKGIVKSLMPYDALFGKGGCASFTAEQADANNYGVFVTGASNGDWAKAFYLDNITFAGYDTIPYGSATATLDASAKTVNVNITSLSNLAGKLIAAEYDKTTGALLQSQVVDADTSTASNYAITFTKDLSANGEYSVFLWENFENIKPLLDTVTVK